GHGGPEAWDTWSGNISFTTDNVDSLTNENKYCAVFSIACKTGKFDWDWGDCLAEAFCKKSNGGAVGVVAAFDDTPDDTNNIFDGWLYTFTYGAPHCNIGTALDAAIFFTQQDTTPYTYILRYTWFGDPLLDLYVTPIYGAPSLAGLELSSKRITKMEKTTLLQNFPNEANPETWIPFVLAKPADVVIEIYDVRGKLIRRLELGHKDAGMYITKDKAAYWDGKNEKGERVTSGIYFYTMKAGDFMSTRKMVILR
ncbi:TPA: T9SS type A sorting domain-containing protein, partial [Candidatus Poribacteria bacterium]|nr:T9SS type A sorting domain-containing protein [Candidatus Poribacteria bacterium]HEX30978.1 T9SS type A sorting domain-containing protein [Candidatus Poribacteria bacterium]